MLLVSSLRLLLHLEQPAMPTLQLSRHRAALESVDRLEGRRIPPQLCDGAMTSAQGQHYIWTLYITRLTAHLLPLQPMRLGAHEDPGTGAERGQRPGEKIADSC